MTLLFIGIALDVAKIPSFVLFLIIFYYFNDIDVDDRSAFFPTSMTLFEVLSLRLISKRRVMGLSLFFVLRKFIAVLLIGVLLILFNK